MATRRHMQREWSPLQESTPGMQELVNKVRTQVEESLRMKFDVYEAVYYSTQVIGGSTTFVKVYVGDDRYIHVRIFEELDGSVTLVAVEDHKKKDDPLTFFGPNL
ncbi:cystatin-A-like [Ptychodera flava]|uniref:cystatin-A-like n=1 Tax=Ptychodera flava TaxID=63121 RepID=UPI00396A1B68